MIDPVLLDLPTSIDTERLRLRPPQAGDGPLLFAAITESLPELRRFLASLPWVAVEQTVESSELYCRNAQANFIARKDLPFLLFEKALVSWLVHLACTGSSGPLRKLRLAIGVGYRERAMALSVRLWKP